MAQDYYFNSHNPNNSNNTGGQPPKKRPPQKKNNPHKKEGSTPKPAQRRQGAPAPGQRPTGTAPTRPPQSAGRRQPPAQRPSAAAKRRAAPGQKRTAPAGANNTVGREMSNKKVNLLRVVFGALVVCAFTGFVTVMTVLIYSINFVNGEVALNLDTAKYAQAQTTFIYGKNEKDEEIELARLHGMENRIWVDMDKMSPYMKEAFIALEDKRFEKHSGVDWFRTLSAVIVHGGSQGGSTITQQLVKNLTDQKSVTFVRKFNEILTALNLEKHFEKDEIVEAYLNTIYLSQGCYGVETAAITYFGKDISELNLAECATLAAITQWPSKYDPLRATRTVLDDDGNEKVINYVEENKIRQELCLEFMLEQDKITQAEYDEAVNYKLIFTNSPEYTGKSAAATALTDQSKDENEYNSYYVDFVIQQVAEEIAAKEGITLQKAKKQVVSGGFKIYTAMDYTVQNILENVYENYVNMPDKTVQSAMTIMDYTGRVVGIVGGTGAKQGDMVLNRAADSPRPPGSTIKPLSIYAPALELNAVYWSKLYADSGSRKSEEQPLLEGKGWPHNDSNEGGNGNKVTLQYALARSLNTVPVRILTDIGFEASKEFLDKKAHLTTLSEKDAAYGPLSLGSLTDGATTLEMAAAYQMFGNGGYYYKPYAYTKVVNSRNEIVLESKPDATKEQMLSPANATIMNQLLQTVATGNGSGAPYSFSNYEIFAKTGTTTGSKDRWFVAGTPYYVASVWYGYDTPKEINYTLSGNRANPSGVIWQNVMKQIHKAKGLKAQNFEDSSDAVSRKYCTLSGLLAGKGCGSTAYGWYDSRNLPGYCTKTHTSTPDNQDEKPNAGGEKPTSPQTPPSPQTPEAPTTPETPSAEPSAPAPTQGGEGGKPDGEDGE